MDNLIKLWRTRFGQSEVGQAAEVRPCYDLGDEWTPTKEQIAEARKRQEGRRANADTRWRRLHDGPDLDAARAAIICATDYVVRGDADATQMRRAIRALVFDGAEIFTRKMRVSSDRYLIEFRHRRMVAGDSQTRVGVRFIGLSVDAWEQQDRVGLYLDGVAERISTVFAPNLTVTVGDADLAEGYVRFALDHSKFGDDQLYVISDLQDFILKPDEVSRNVGEADASLTAQFRVAVAPQNPDSDPVPEEEALLGALQVPRDAIVPPTVLRLVPANDAALAHAIVFTTVIYRAQLYHVCFTVSSDGQIRPAGAERRQTSEGATLPLIPVRSFDQQRATFKREFGEVSNERK